MYLHREDQNLLRDIIVTVSERTGITDSIVEKDYYVTMILRELADRSPNAVFKGGTSLSKAYHVIDRFSEDIDMTFEEHLGEARRKKIKYQLMKPLSEELGLPIGNWTTIESDKDYNHYDFLYQSVSSTDSSALKPYVKLETALMSYAFPVEVKSISNIIYDCLAQEEPDILKEYGLIPFPMKVQTLQRTIIDKLFAVCDYYILNRPARNSRHLYDIYKLKDYVTIDANFRALFHDVRAQRAGMNINVAPSARENVDLLETAGKLIRDDFYMDDYRTSTIKLITDNISYEMVKAGYLDIMKQILT